MLTVCVREDVGPYQYFVGHGARMHRVVEPTPAQLRFCEDGSAVVVSILDFDEAIAHEVEAALQASGGHNRQVIEMGVVLRIRAVLGAHERDHWHVNAGHAEMSLVAASVEVGVLDGAFSASHHASRNSVKWCVAQSRGEVGEIAFIADTGQVDRSHYARAKLLEVPCDVRDRSDGLRPKDKAVGVPPRWQAHEPARDPNGDHRSGQLVVGQRRMTHVGGDEHLLGTFPGDDELAVGEAAGCERCIDNRVVFAVRE